MAPLHNLALVRDPALFGPDDYKAISAEIQKLADDIRVYILPDAPGVAVPPGIADHPLMTFCPTQLHYFNPPRGAVFCGQRIRKDEQLKRLAKGGVRVPKWTYLTAGLRLSAAEWGENVIVKPIDFLVASKGRGVELVLTPAVGSLPVYHQAARAQTNAKRFIVQKFIDSGTHSSDYRVMTLFGRPLYALKRTSGIPLEMPNLANPRISSGVVSNASGGPRELGFCYEEDVLKFAASCFRAIPNVPLQAVDVRRETGTGRLYCLEINPGGNTWNFSSQRSRDLPLIEGIRREDQFGAWRIAAEALIENVRLFAR